MRTSLSVLAVIVFFSACSTNNVTVDDSLGRFFDSAGVKGDFALFDNGQGRFTIYNLPRYRDSLYPAGSTFDILQALVAFQTGVLKDEKVVAMGKDSSVTDPAHTGQTIDVKVPVTYARAMQDRKSYRHVERLSDSIGIDTLRKWVDSLQYGNKDGSGPNPAMSSFATSGSTPTSNSVWSKSFISTSCPFSNVPQQLVRDMMTKEANSNYKLVIKTGRAAYLPGPAIGWVMGWVEENQHPYFFVINVESSDGRADIESIGIHMAKRILLTMGFFQGKK